MEEMDIEEQKKARTALKTKVSTSANRLIRGVTRKSAGNLITNLYQELEISYSDFEEIDDLYNSTIEADEEGKREKYGTVNNLDCAQYTAAVRNIYFAAIEAYKMFVVDEVATSFRDLSKKIDRIFSKMEEEQDSTKLERAAERATELKVAISSLEERKRECPSADWDEVIDNIGDKIEMCETRLAATFSRINGKSKAPMNDLTPITTISSLLRGTTLFGSAPITTTPFTTSHSQFAQYGSISLAGLNSRQSLMSTGFPTFPDSRMPFQPPASPMQPPSSPVETPTSPFQGTPHTTHNNSTFPRNEVRVKKAELPVFSGERKDWPEFKALWPQLAATAFQSPELLACELRRCVRGRAQGLLVNISITGPEAIHIMWGKLVDHYEDATATVNEIMLEIEKLKPVKSEDYRALTDFANKIEGWYTQLAAIDQLANVGLVQVDRLCNLLPVRIKEGWHEIHKGLGDHQTKMHPFTEFTMYLIQRRTAVSRLVDQEPVVRRSKEVFSHGTGVVGNAPKQKVKWKCVIHRDSELVAHVTENCKTFIALTRDEKYEALKEVHACFRCFENHNRRFCKFKKPCQKCGKIGHHTLLCRAEEQESSHGTASHVTSDVVHIPTTSHNTYSAIPASSHAALQKSVGIYAIFSVPVVSAKHRCNVFTDDGSDASYITTAAARRLGAKKLRKCLLEVTTTGGQETQYEAQEYELKLVTVTGKVVPVNLFGMSKITGELAKLDVTAISKIFPSYDVSTLQRKSAEVDVLLGTDFFGLHPKREVDTAGENLSIMEGSLGVSLQGSHPLIKARNCLDSNMVKVLKSVNIIQCETHNASFSQVQHPLFKEPHKSQANHSTFTSSDLENYVRGEELGIYSHQKCGSCKCGKCPQPGHTFSFQEEMELNLIRDNLKYNEENSCWVTKYPWKFDPNLLPDNENATFSTLQRLEKKLQKDDDTAAKHHEQIMDMVKRGAARKLSPAELKQYKGPKFYISHLGALNPKSKSTPYRIVFNSSQLHKGVSLNNWLYKGPDCYMNNQLGALLRWREEEVALYGDIRKMFNSVYLETMEQHCHRFLWRGLESSSTCDTYVMTRVNMGDRPAGAISTEALYKTAEKFGADCPRVAEMIKLGTYVDDLLESVASKEAAKSLSEEGEAMLLKGGFSIKFWIFSGDKVEEDDGVTVILGVCWNSEQDTIVFNSSLNFSPKKHGVHLGPDLKPHEVPHSIPVKLTKRIVLAQMMRIYDPIGFVCAFILKGKILLRETWEKRLEWDEPLPEDLRSKWVEFLCAVYDLGKLEYPRSMKPPKAEGYPTLILLSDASEKAYGFVAYARWLCTDGSFQSRFVMAKNRIAPLIQRSTPQLELNGAVVSKRGRGVIEKEVRYKFEKVLHIVDSEIVLAMLHKTSTRFKLYEGVRVGEIQAASNGDISEWAWIAGTKNTADWLTRGKDPCELTEESEWFHGPSFLSKPIAEWGLQFNPSSEVDIPGVKKQVSSNSAECKSPFIKYQNFSSYRRLVRSLARIINMFQQKKLVAIKENPDPILLGKSEKIIIKDMQRLIEKECLKKDQRGRVGGAYYRLKPTLVQGYFRVGTRMSYNPMVPENEPQYLLPSSHPVTTLMMKQAHIDNDHRSRDSTVSRFRQKFWVPHAGRIASSVINSCLLCRIRKPKLLTQRMGALPEVRSKPAPPFTYVMIDYFGPYSVRGDIQKRVTGKAWGVIFADLVSRAVHLESVFDYGTDSFLIALSKFASVRGYPEIIYSDPGSNLTCASRELSKQWEEMMKEEKISAHSSENGLKWKFSAADAPWQNGAVEALVKSCKRSLNFAMQHQRLSPSEFSGVLYEVANTLNERPIGVASSDSVLSVLTPNSLLLGRSTSKNPGGWHPTSCTQQRFHLVQQICTAFWKQWIQTCAPALITDEKWHSQQENLQPGDVVLVLDSDSMRAEYRLAIIKEVYPGSDTVVRKVKIMYKRYKVKDTAVTYTGSTEQCCIRPVQRLALVLPYKDNVDG